MRHNSIRTDGEIGLGVSVKQGNRQSFGLLYDKYAPALYGIIRMIAGNKKLAEKILSEQKKTRLMIIPYMKKTKTGIKLVHPVTVKI